MEFKFHSITSNSTNLTIEQVANQVQSFMNGEPHYDYDIVIGTDSQNFTNDTKMVCVVAVHRRGHGGIFFFDISHVELVTNVKRKLILETSVSLECAQKFVDVFEIPDRISHTLTIHIDAGEGGESRVAIPSIVGWVCACGYNYSVKPDSYAASSIANKYSK